jgi:hypothetical protein
MSILEKYNVLVREIGCPLTAALLVLALVMADD